MTREINDVVVQGISLVSKKKTPAVVKAESRFALFKTHNPRIGKVQNAISKFTDFLSVDGHEEKPTSELTKTRQKIYDDLQSKQS